MITRYLCLLPTAAMFLGISATANAQPAPPPPQTQPSTVVRSGFMIGFAAGAGSMVPDCDGCNSENGLATGFSIGGFLQPDLAIMYDASAIIDFENEFILVNSISALAVQKWIGPKLWIKGGIGLANLSISDGHNEADSSGFGLMAAGGFDLSQSGNFALDLQLRVGSAFYSENNVDLTLTNVGLLLGVNWY